VPGGKPIDDSNRSPMLGAIPLSKFGGANFGNWPGRSVARSVFDRPIFENPGGGQRGATLPRTRILERENSAKGRAEAPEDHGPEDRRDGARHNPSWVHQRME
jgi:hypothetical protein